MDVQCWEIGIQVVGVYSSRAIGAVARFDFLKRNLDFMDHFFAFLCFIYYTPRRIERHNGSNERVQSKLVCANDSCPKILELVYVS